MLNAKDADSKITALSIIYNMVLLAEGEENFACKKKRNK